MTNSADYGEARSLTPSVLTRPNRKTFIIRHVTLVLVLYDLPSDRHFVFTPTLYCIVSLSIPIPPSSNHNYTCLLYQLINHQQQFYF